MERIFNSYKIRYELLNPQMLPIRASKRIKTINIYISIDDFYHKLHRPITDKEFQTTGKSASREVVSNLINLAGHYKHWAINEGLRPNIYLYYTTSNIFRNEMIIKEYRDYFKHITDPNYNDYFFVNMIMKDSLDILPIIIKYIPKVYTINTNYIEPSVIPLYLSEINNPDFNLIISKDEYDLQYTQYDKWGVIIPKGDVSTLITSGNLWMYIKEKQKIPFDFYFHPEMYVWAKCIVGDKYRSIPKLTRTSYPTVIKYLEKCSSLGDDSIEVLELQLRRLADYINSKKIQDTEFNNNMSCISVSKQLDRMLEIDKMIIANQITDMQDNRALMETNRTIFKEFPLKLNFLLQELPPINYTPMDDYSWRKRGNYGTK